MCNTSANYVSPAFKGSGLARAIQLAVETYRFEYVICRLFID